MRIAMLAPISWRTPPRHYGPWELVTSLLTEALVAKAESLDTGKRFVESEYDVDDVVSVITPEPFHAVGLWYDEFSETTDEQVRPLTISHGASASHPGRPRFRMEFDWTGTRDPSTTLLGAADLRECPQRLNAARKREFLQLAGEHPIHIILPAIEKTAEDVAEPSPRGHGGPDQFRGADQGADVGFAFDLVGVQDAGTHLLSPPCDVVPVCW